MYTPIKIKVLFCFEISVAFHFGFLLSTKDNLYFALVPILNFCVDLPS